MDLNEFRLMLIEYRKKYELTQADMARLCGVSRPTIHSIETKDGHYRPNLITMHKIERIIKKEGEE